MKFSLFSCATDNHPAAIDDTWEAFCARLATIDRTHTVKTDVAMWSPAEFKEGATRSAENALRVSSAVADLDHLPESTINDVFARIESLGLAWVYHNTWRHAEYEPDHGARLIIPLSRSVEAVEWSAFWPRWNALLNNVMDSKCKDISRCYFLPSCPSATSRAMLSTHSEGGTALDVDALLAEPFTHEMTVAIVGSHKVTFDELRDFVNKLRKKPSKIWLRDRLRLLLQGEPIDVVGERDNTIYKLTGDLVENWPNIDAEHFEATHCKASMQLMQPCKEGWFSDKIKAHQRKQQQETEQKRNEALEQSKALIFEALGREQPYTPDELKTFGDMRRRWILQKDNTAWLFAAGGWKGPFNYRNELSRAALTYLSPASTAGVQLYKVNDKGTTTPKSEAELVREYGQLVEQLELSLDAQGSTFDPVTKTLTEAACPRRPLTPQFNNEIQVWLSTLAGKHLDTLTAWLAGSTLLSRACAALYLWGRPGSGKSMLIKGLSRLWTTNGPTSLDAALGSFNSELSRCPLIFGDEKVPTDFRGNAKTDAIRALIQDSNQPFKRKHVPDSKINGYVRLAIAANSPNLLSTYNTQTPDDINAVNARVFYLYVPSVAAERLEKMDTTGWVSNDLIARHILALAEKHPPFGNERFLINVPRTEEHEAMLYSGLRGASLHWLMSYLMSPAKLDVTANKHAVKRLEGSLYVNAHLVHPVWEMYPTGVYAPRLEDLSKALDGITSGRARRLRAGEDRAYYREIDRTRLLAFASRQGADVQSLEKVLDKKEGQAIEVH